MKGRMSKAEQEAKHESTCPVGHSVPHVLARGNEGHKGRLELRGPYTKVPL